MPKITRFSGVVVPGWHGPRPGGGVSGVTEDLDRVVLEAAEALRAWFGADVEVRFNSDHHSGGAFVVDKETQDEVGITAGLYPTELWSEGVTAADWRRKYDALPRVLGMGVFVGVDHLLDESLATQGTFGASYALVAVNSVEAAVAWFEAHVKRERTKRYTAEELAAWKTRFVTEEFVPRKGEGRAAAKCRRAGLLSASFYNCIRHVGSHAEYTIKYEGASWTEESLAAWFRAEKSVSEADALDVVRVVFQLMPRRG